MDSTGRTRPGSTEVPEEYSGGILAAGIRAAPLNITALQAWELRGTVNKHPLHPESARRIPDLRTPCPENESSGCPAEGQGGASLIKGNSQDAIA